VFPAATAIGGERLAAKFVRGDHKDAVWRFVWNVNYSQNSTGESVADGYARAVTAGAILSRPCKCFFYLVLRNGVSVDVRLVSLRIDVVANLHDFDPSCRLRLYPD
jgi:hypothetical protein